MRIALVNEPWEIVNRIIEAETTEPKSDECTICNEIVNPHVSCSSCGKIFCLLCYTKLFRLHNGLIPCPFCRTVDPNSKDIDLTALGGVEKAIEKIHEGYLQTHGKN